jgi:hypothetical protein
MVIELDPAAPRAGDEEIPSHVNPILWQQSLGLARQISARVFRDGGRASDALAALGLKAEADVTWDKAVELIARELSRSRAPAPARDRAA